MELLTNVLLILSVFLLALITGLFYGFSCAVNRGLRKLSGLEYLKSMQSINKEILNPVFFLSFIGALISLPVATWFVYISEGKTESFYFILAGSILYACGTFAVTVVNNVPLNDRLARYKPEDASETEIIKMRNSFEQPWNRYHLVRTFFCITSLLFSLTAILFRV